MKYYTSFGYVENDEPEYDSIEQFAFLRNLSYDYQPDLETILENYPADYVIIPDGKPYLTAKVPFIIPGYIEKGKIYRNTADIFLGLATNFILLNKKIPDILIFKYLEELNRNHAMKYLPVKVMEDLYKMLLEDRNILKEYQLEYKVKGVIKTYGFIDSKKEWINPKCKDKKLTYYNRYKISIDEIVNNLPDRKVTMQELSEKSAYSDRKSFANSLTSEQKAIIKSHNKKYNKR